MDDNSPLSQQGETLKMRLALRGGSWTSAFDVESERGSAHDAIIGLGTGSIRTAVVGQYTPLHPLRLGEHEIYGLVDFAMSQRTWFAPHVVRWSRS